jgi:hypothetical protein
MDQVTVSFLIFKILIFNLHSLSNNYECKNRSRDSVVGIENGYGLDDRGVGVRVPVWSRKFLHVIQTGSGVHPTSNPMGTGVKLPGRQAYYSRPASAEVNKMWIYTSIPPYALIA